MATPAVTATAGRPHNDLVMHLFRLLDAVCPPDVTIYNVPYDCRLADGSQLVPDLTVARTADLDVKRLTKTPLLVVEDPLVKREKYQQAGVPAYDATRAVLTSESVEVRLEQPFPVTVYLPR